MTIANGRSKAHRSLQAAAPRPTDTMPRQLSAEELADLFALNVAEIEVEAARPTEPRMSPPGSLSAREGANSALSGEPITALWADQSNRNAWVFLQTSGWKRLDPLTDTGSTVLTLLAAHARAVGSAPYADENPAGTLTAMHVW